MKGLSLKTKTFVLLICIVLLSIVPVVVYSVKATNSLAQLGRDPDIDKCLVQAVQRASAPLEAQSALMALKKFRQAGVLKDVIVRQVLIFSVAYAAFIVVCALIIGYVFISRITRPLRSLTKATRMLASGEQTFILDKSRGGEVGQLMEAFTTMAHDLTQARLQKIAAERRATWQRVARIIAHEIKNPLTPIKLSTERMYDKFLNSSPDFAQVIQSTTATILSEIANLQKLVDTFHTYAKFPDPVLHAESLNDIIAETCALFTSQAATLECDFQKNIPSLPLDRDQIRQAFTNLIKNALEATLELAHPGKVSITSHSRAQQIFVTVSDNGCGISEENQKKLFQPYFTTKHDGNGIGLALTERIISLHNGKINCVSAPGQGTTFTITFETR